MRYLGIDYGSKRVGLALSDESAQFAFPYSVVQNSSSLVNDVRNICQENNVGEIVVGESRDFAQQENEIMKSIRPFVTDLAKATEIPVHLHPEFLTSAEAEHLQGKNNMLDASAAALILKSYLDTLNATHNT